MGSSPNVSWFADITLNDRRMVGGKGGSLGELTRAGIKVPPGFVVRTPAFEHFLQWLEKQEPIRSRVESFAPHELDEITVLSERTRARLENAALPDGLQGEVLAAHTELCGDHGNSPVAVRSSATTED